MLINTIKLKEIDKINRKEIIVRINDSINDWKDVVLAKYSDTMSQKNKLDKDSLIMNITFFHQLCREGGGIDRKCLEDLKKNIRKQEDTDIKKRKAVEYFGGKIICFRCGEQGYGKCGCGYHCFFQRRS